MNNLVMFIKNKLLELTLKKNKLLDHLGLLSTSSESFGSIHDILKNLNSSKINLQLHKEDSKDKDYIFSIINTLEKNGIQVTLTEFDKIFSNEDVKNISQFCKTAKIDFRYVYPNFWGATNINTKMDIKSYLKILKKIEYLTKVATSNFIRKEEQIIFIANQISEYVTYDFENEKKSEEEYLKLSSLQGCLEDRNTVCAGIAFAFERCMTEMGIKNILILGYSGKKDNPSGIDNNHVWNKVYIDGKWYNVDITNILKNPNTTLSKEERVNIFILSSDKSLSKVGNVITDYSNIPDSNENFAETLDIYRKINKVKNVLKDYDNGNRNLFLKYKVEYTNTSNSIEQLSKTRNNNKKDGKTR